MICDLLVATSALICLKFIILSSYVLLSSLLCSSHLLLQNTYKNPAAHSWARLYPNVIPNFSLSSLTRILPFKNLVVYLQCKGISDNQDLTQRSESSSYREHLDHVFQVQRHVGWVYPCSVASCLWYSSSLFLTVPLKILIHLPGNYLHSFLKHLRTGMHLLDSFPFLSSYWEK